MASVTDQRNAQISSIALDVLSKLPQPFDLQVARIAFPTVYAESLNTVLIQELQRYNTLLGVMVRTLKDVRSALAGDIVMSPDLERMCENIYDAKVPECWGKFTYPSLKPLGPWVIDFNRRIEMFARWLERKAAPTVFWISGFFFTQSFLTGMLQNYARKYKIAIDTLSFEFDVLPEIHPDHPIAPADGCYVHGLFLEGARWDNTAGLLVEPLPRQLFAEMPVIWLKPKETRKMTVGRQQYVCPVYKTSLRHGVLTTQGLSSNYVIAIRLPSNKEERHWIRRGVALLCQLDM